MVCFDLFVACRNLAMLAKEPGLYLAFCIEPRYLTTSDNNPKEYLHAGLETFVSSAVFR